MSAPRTSAFLQNLRKSGLLDESQLQEIASWPSATAGDDRALAQELVDREFLSRFQAHLLLSGRTQGFVIGPYTIVDRIGAGGMGQVYKAVHRHMLRTVALKVLTKSRRADPDAQSRFMREVRASAQLNHPNIVTAYDVGEEGNVTYLVLEYVEGASVAELVKQHGRLAPDQVAAVGYHVASALEHARRQGIVHRDIKPGNILVGNEGTCKVLDMGLARFEEGGPDVDESTSLTRDGVVMGSINYLSPEQAMNSHQADTRSDIYSLGCTLYHMLAGQVPFPGGTAAEKLIKHQMHEPTPLAQLAPHAPPELVQVVVRMMTKSVDDRYQTPAEVAQGLEPWTKVPLTEIRAAPAGGQPAVSEATVLRTSASAPPVPSAVPSIPVAAPTPETPGSVSTPDAPTPVEPTPAPSPAASDTSGVDQREDSGSGAVVQDPWWAMIPAKAPSWRPPAMITLPPPAVASRAASSLLAMPPLPSPPKESRTRSKTDWSSCITVGTSRESGSAGSPS